MKLALIVAVLCGSIGCAGGHKIKETSPLEGKLGAYSVVQIAAKSSDEDAGEDLGSFRSALVAKLTERDLFKGYVTHEEPGAADLRLAVTLTGIRRVSETTRFLVGGMAGKAKLFADVELIEIGTGRTLGSFKIEGKSSGGTVAAGTTPEAVVNAANGIAQYIADHR